MTRAMRNAQKRDREREAERAIRELNVFPEEVLVRVNLSHSVVVAHFRRGRNGRGGKYRPPVLALTLPPLWLEVERALAEQKPCGEGSLVASADVHHLPNGTTGLDGAWLVTYVTAQDLPRPLTSYTKKLHAHRAGVVRFGGECFAGGDVHDAHGKAMRWLNNTLNPRDNPWEVPF